MQCAEIAYDSVAGYLGCCVNVVQCVIVKCQVRKKNVPEGRKKNIYAFLNFAEIAMGFDEV